MEATYYLVFKVVASLCLVLSTFFILVWYMKRTVLPQQESALLKVRGRVMVAPGSQLLLVEAAGRLYLIGLSDKGFSVIDSLGEEGLQMVEDETRAMAQGEESNVDSEVISQLLRLDRLRHQRKVEG